MTAPTAVQNAIATLTHDGIIRGCTPAPGAWTTFREAGVALATELNWLAQQAKKQATAAAKQATAADVQALTLAVNALAAKIGPLAGHLDVTGVLDLTQPPA
jgi:hypothetical protein